MNIHIIYRKEMFIKIIIYLIIFFVLGLAFMYAFKSRILSASLVIMMVLPILFFKLLQKKFTKEMRFMLYPSYFTAEESNESTADLKKIDLDELAGYIIQIPNSKFSAITFKLKNRKSIEFSFFQKKEKIRTSMPWS